MKKILKFLFAGLLICICIAMGFCIYCQSVISTIDKSLISNITLSMPSNHTTIFDNQNQAIKTHIKNGNNSVAIEQLNKQTTNAFIAIEDKDFYTHHGISPKRILKAGFKNLKNGYNKEGASTITQQLVKNTLLSNEKTFERKIKEAYLATQLENKFSKNEILQSYLNAVYFGSGAYGIEDASNLFFNKSAKDLDLCESATLAGLLKSPKNYSPIYNKEKCKQRRDIVLKCMKEQNFITQGEYEKAVIQPVKVLQNSSKNCDLYVNYTMKEASQILNLSEKDIANKGYKIYTFLDNNTKLNSKFETLFNNESKGKELDGCLVVIDNQTMGVNMLLSNKNSELKKRQPASLIKPLLCYAPAFELDILAPATPILDEQTSFNGYNPKNYDEKYDGWISSREALIKSKNIPAIKALMYVGIDKAKEYATKNGIEFDKSDNHLAIALGSLKYGITPLEIASSYCTLSNNGEYEKAHFVKRIEDKFGNVIYSLANKKTKVFKDETCYMINDILKQTATDGTAKRLSQFKNIYAKTGTNGTNNTNENLDAWCVAYNPEKTVCSWIGNTSGNSKNNLKKEQNGSNLGAKFCELIIKNLDINFEKTYKKPSTIVTKNIIKKQVNGQQILLIDNDKMQKNITENDIFTMKYVSKMENNTNLQQNTIFLDAKKIGKRTEFSFNSLNGKTYLINKLQNGKTEIIKSVIGDYPNTSFSLDNCENNTEYYVSLKEDDTEILSNKIKILNENKPIEKNNSVLKNWFFK